MNCYTCGLDTETRPHDRLCPDHPVNRRRMPYLTQAQCERLLPVGGWAYSDQGMGLGARFRRDHTAEMERRSA